MTASIIIKPCFVTVSSLARTTANTYWTIDCGNGTNGNAALATAQTQMPISGTFQSLTVDTSAPPGDGGYDYTLLINGVASDLTVHLGDTDTSVSHSAGVTVAEGDLVAIQVSEPGSPNQIISTVMMEFVPDNPGETFTTAMASGNLTTFNANPNSSQQRTTPVYCPSAFTLDKLYCNLNARTGTARQYTVYVVKNGVKTDLKAVFAAANDDTGQYATNLVDSVHFDQGDLIAFEMDLDIGASINKTVGIACRLIPDVDGEIPYFGTIISGVYAGADRYYAAVGNGGVTATEASFKARIADTYTFKNLSFYSQSDAPGAGTSFTLASRINGVTGNVAAVMSDTALEAHDYTHSDSLVDGDFLNLVISPSNNPTPATYSFSFVLQATTSITPPPITRRHQARYTYFL